jgi:hypothetical protein
MLTLHGRESLAVPCALKEYLALSLFNNFTLRTSHLSRMLTPSEGHVVHFRSQGLTQCYALPNEMLTDAAGTAIYS